MYYQVSRLHDLVGFVLKNTWPSRHLCFRTWRRSLSLLPLTPVCMWLSLSTHLKISTVWLSSPTPSATACSLIHSSALSLSLSLYLSLSLKSTVAFHHPTQETPTCAEPSPIPLLSRSSSTQQRRSMEVASSTHPKPYVSSPPWCAIPHLDGGHGGFPWWIHGAWRKSSGVVVSYTQQMMMAHPPSHPWRRLDLQPQRRPRPMCLPSFPLSRGYIRFCGVTTIYLRYFSCCSFSVVIICFLVFQLLHRNVAIVLLFWDVEVCFSCSISCCSSCSILLQCSMLLQ